MLDKYKLLNMSSSEYKDIIIIIIIIILLSLLTFYFFVLASLENFLQPHSGKRSSMNKPRIFPKSLKLRGQFSKRKN